MLTNTPWIWKFSGRGSWTQYSHHRGTGPTPGWGTERLQVIQHGQRKKKKEGKENIETKSKNQTKKMIERKPNTNRQKNKKTKNKRKKNSKNNQ